MLNKNVMKRLKGVDSTKINDSFYFYLKALQIIILVKKYRYFDSKLK